MMCQFTKVTDDLCCTTVTIEALDMYCRPENINNKPMLTINALDLHENTNTDLGYTSDNNDILRSTSHHLQCLNSQ